MIYIEIFLVLIAVYAFINIASFYKFSDDKKRALKNIRRTPEKTLLIFALAGPFGALAAMKVTHHKTKKKKFWLVYFFVFLHILFFYFIFSGFLLR
ncbi:uncharacterized membrane protein YsdA (DUF1294 family) [Methanomicrobium sp. W14]|uniref:DUF1294 domain-containing protein n=1 Tax=Methanomicrobium sp. W14 TaxID=2817839 RepID=UPI001AEA61F8|nr:DUF1294 domain-containing protein [Methanomicrobium sp. W14]MBP2132321.1 uncharacterized membrane protein YsdA (DUF1294 family) [Methanomicrobium sp. W14]